MEYQDKVDWLFNQFPVFQKVGATAYKPTLENSLALIKFLGVPINQMKFVHVAGTNGKGTTCSIIASALTESGQKVGLFTSPHIKDFRERIRINGEMISKEEVSDYISRFQKEKLSFSPSFFEMTWAMAVDYFYRQNCDIIVVETGLGGRLDATNIITPLITAITNISIDHSSILGNTKEAIAHEKAGIIKNNILVIIGENDIETEDVFLKKAIQEKAPIYFCDNSEILNTFEKNKALAFEIVERLPLNPPINLNSIKERAIINLSLNTGLYGRHYIYSENPLIIMDAGHNVIGVKRFLDDIQREYPEKRVRVLYGASNDKDINSIVQLFPKNWEYYITEFNSHRSAKIEDLMKIKEINKLNPKYFHNSIEAFSKAQTLDKETDILLVFGSFYLLEEII